MFNGRLLKLGSGQHWRAHRLRRSRFYPRVVWISYAQSNKKQISTTNMTRAHSIATGGWAGRNMTEFHETVWGRRHVSKGSPLGLLSRRWRSPAPLSPAPTPSAAFLVSAAERSRGWEMQTRKKTWVNTTSLNQNAAWYKLDKVKGCAFGAHWHFPAQLHHLVSQSPAPELWLSGSSKGRR